MTSLLRRIPASFAPMASPSLEAMPSIPFGDGRTCAQLVQDTLTIESGTNECRFKELNEMIACCPPTEIVNPCTICPDGISACNDHVPVIWPIGTWKAFRDDSR